MDRREALKRTAFLMGTAVSSSVAYGILNGCSTKPGLTWTPVFFTEDQAVLVTQLAEIIIPQTDTPGAKAVGVPAFIEEMVRDVYSKEEQDRFISGITLLNQWSKEETGELFNDLDEEDQIEFVKRIHDEAILRTRSEDNIEQPFILMVKELTLLGFFTSQPGAEEVLQYRAMPGAYHGCITVEEAGGKTWAT